MKYINEIIDINADGESFEKAYHIEINKLELSMVLKALEVAIDSKETQLYKEYQKLLEKFKLISYYADKGQKNKEL